MAILRMTEISMVRSMCGVQFKDRKRSTDLMFILDMKETTDKLAMANNVRWYGHMLRREDGHVLRRALYFEDKGERKKGRPKRMWKKQVEEQWMNVGLSRKDMPCQSMLTHSISQTAIG